MSDRPKKPTKPTIDASGPQVPFAKMTGTRRVRPGSEPPPQALDAEQSVLGSMLIEPSCVGPLLDLLPDDSLLYDDRHRAILAGIRSLHADGAPVDLVSLSERLKRLGTYDDAGGGYALAELTTRVASSANAEFHARVVIEKAIQRATIHASRVAIRDASDPTADPFDTLDALDGRLWAIQKKASAPTLLTAAGVLPSVSARLRRETVDDDRIGSTGFAEIDAIQGGLYRGALHVTAASSGTGKTTYALDLTWDTAVRQQIGVAYFSVETGAQRLTERMIGMGAGLPARSVRAADLLPGHVERLEAAERELRASNIFFDETPRLHISQVESRSRRLVKYEGVTLIVVDYLQRIDFAGLAHDLASGVSLVSGRLKSLARELNVPIVALSQVTKEAGRAVRTGSRPTLNDLRGSEDVGNDADTVSFIYRPHAYGLDFDEQTQRSTPGWAEFVFRKVRDGVPGTATVPYDALTASFVNAPFRERDGYTPPEPDLF